MRRTYSFQAVLTILAMSLAVGLPVVAGASESTDEASGDVDFVELAPDDDEAMGLMEVACSGEVERSESDDSAGGVPVCDSCPQGAANEHGELRLEGAYIGDFSGDGVAHAVLATTGCELSFNARHSTVILRNSGDSWSKIKYEDHINSSGCEHVASEERDWLMCKSTTVGQGAAETFVMLSYMEGDSLESESLVTLQDNSGACRFEGQFRKVIEKQVVGDLNDDGMKELALGIRADVGSLPSGVDEVEDRCDEEAYEVRHEKSVAVFSLKASGPERNEALESSLEYSSLADSGSSSGNSTEEDAVKMGDVLEAICDEGSPTDGGCDSCPGYTSGFAPHGDEPFSQDTSKSFLFDETYSANLAATFEGCESTEDLTQGMVFLGQEDGQWERLGYGSGLDADKCLTFEHDDGKSVLVCSHYEGANGTEINRLIQVSEDGGNIQFEEVDQFVHDSPMVTCQRDRFTNARLQDIEKRGSELHVEVKKFDVEIPSEFDHSCDPGFEQPELSRSTKTYRFDGEGFEAVDGDGE